MHPCWPNLVSCKQGLPFKCVEIRHNYHRILKVTFHFSSLDGPASEFLNGMDKFSELVLARMALLLDQSHSVLLLGSAKA